MSVTAEHVAEWAKLQPPKGKGKPTPEQVRACSMLAKATFSQRGRVAAIQARKPRCHPLLVLHPVSDPLSSVVDGSQSMGCS